MTVKLLNPYLHLYARFNYLFEDCGHTFEEIAEIELNNPIYGDVTELSEQEKAREKESLLLLINHCFGKATDQDIAHLCPPSKPHSVEYVRPVEEEHLCVTKGTESGDFYVLITLKRDEEYAHKLVKENNELITYLAYKNAHEGSSFGVSGEVDFAQAGIHATDLKDLVS
ncbi:hypothetical protein L4D76_26625 [Photobacterium sagamiensis]|uniref:hypothetical protein n=1 Tax=Photobacterium sagamiensis TaxID=2910241 RepID=UPI003D140B68